MIEKQFQRYHKILIEIFLISAKYAKFAWLICLNSKVSKIKIIISIQCPWKLIENWQNVLTR